MTHKKFLLLRLLVLRTVLTVLILAAAFAVAAFVTDNPSQKNILLPIVIVSVLLVIILFSLFGKIFCGFFCPIGFLNDFVWRITLKLHLPKLSRSEEFMKKINILQKIFFVFFVIGITSLIVIALFFPEILRSIHIPLYAAGIIAATLIVSAFFARRLFCNVCPIGTLIGFFQKLNIVKLEKDCSACTMCGACYEACPMRIKSVYTEQEKTDVSSKQCLYCGECIKNCQQDDALSITIGGRKVYKSSREDFMNNQFSHITLKRED